MEEQPIGRGGRLSLRPAAGGDGADAYVDRVGAVRRNARAPGRSRASDTTVNQLAGRTATLLAAEAVSLIAHPVSFERPLLRVARISEDGGDDL